MTAWKRIPATLVAVAVLGACASLSTMQTGEVTPDGDWQLGLNLGASAPITGIFELLDYQQTQEAHKIINGVLMGLLFPPLPVFDLSARYGVAQGWDLGLRLSQSSTRIDGRYQIIDREEVDLAVGLGLSWYHWAMEHDDLGDNQFKRGELDVSLICSLNLSEVFKPYLGLKWIGSRYSLSDTLDTDKIEGSDDQVTLEVEGPASAAGGLIGFYLGTSWVYFVMEFNFFYAKVTGSGSAEIGPYFVDTGDLEINDQSFDGLVIYPALGVVFIF